MTDERGIGAKCRYFSSWSAIRRSPQPQVSALPFARATDEIGENRIIVDTAMHRFPSSRPLLCDQTSAVVLAHGRTHA